MPLYVYKNDETGETVELQVSIAERDNQPGFTRKQVFEGSVWSPTANGGMS